MVERKATGRACERRLEAQPAWVVSLLLLAVLFVGRSDAPAAEKDAAPPAARPNVVVLMIDTLRADHLGCYGYSRQTSPSIDRFAARSVLFERAVASAPQTVPSVLSMWTGLYPSRHGNQYFLRTDSFRAGKKGIAPQVPANVALLAESLQSRGYRTGAIVTNPWLRARYGFARGFDVYRRPKAEPGKRYAKADAVNREGGELLAQWKDAQPFFLYLHYMDVHWPYDPLPTYRSVFATTHGRRFYVNGRAPNASARNASFTRDLYDADIRGLDDAVGGFLAELAARGLDDSTVVVLIGDHGDAFLEHGGLGHGWGLFEELIHVPLIVFDPRGDRRGRRVEAPVSAADLFPTVIELTGGTPPSGLDGVSLADAIRGSGKPLSDERVLYSELGFGLAARTGRYKLIRWLDPPSDRFFDLADDPSEQSPVAEATSWRSALDRKLSSFQSRRLASVAQGAPGKTIDPATAERLRALGYR